MAKTNPIDSISINNVKYDFDPTELSSLTVTGNLTVNGTTATFNNITADTANLSVIKTDEWDNLSNPTKGYIETALIKGMTSPSTMIISAANLTQSVLQQYYLSCNQATISTNTISLYHKSGTDVNISGIASNLKIQSTLTSSGTIELIADNIKFRKFTGAPNYYLNFPVGKSGTIATVADIKSYYTHYITLYRTSYFYISFQITNTTSTKYNSLSAVAKAVDSIAPYDIAASIGIPCIGIIKGNNSTTLSIPVNLYSDENMTSLIVNTCGVINSNGGNISAYTSAYTISATYTVINDLVK